MKHILCILFLIIHLLNPWASGAQGTYGSQTPTHVPNATEDLRASPYLLLLKRELGFIGAGLSSTIAGRVLENSKPSLSIREVADLDRNNVPSIDRFTLDYFSKKAAGGSDHTWAHLAQQRPHRPCKTLRLQPRHSTSREKYAGRS